MEWGNRVLCALIVHGVALANAGSASAENLLLTDALIVDGTGGPPFVGEVLIADGRIKAVGRSSSLARLGTRQESLRGLALAPGFIDLHNHTEYAVAEHDATLISQLAQGITTALLGLDGRSHQPLEDFFRRFNDVPPRLNVAFLAGHESVRNTVMGTDATRRATPAEIEQMQELVDQAMLSGAFGLSTGLEFQPGMSATTEELIALAKRVASAGGIYVTHLRDETAKMPEALEETLRIGCEAEVPVHVSHIKRAIPADWGKASATVLQLHTARAAGVDVTADVYPYTAWHSGIDVLVLNGKYTDPASVAAGLEAVGGARFLTISRAYDDSLRGHTMESAAKREGVTPVELYTRLMARGGADVIGQTMSSADVDTFVREPLISIASDGGTGIDLWGMTDDDYSHPRGTGTYPKVLREYVRERGILKLEEAIRKMTSLPASRLGLGDRGSIRPGMWADLVLLDPAQVRERSTFDDPRLLPEGIERVWVNGEVVYDGGSVTPARPGYLLRHSITSRVPSRAKPCSSARATVTGNVN